MPKRFAASRCLIFAELRVPVCNAAMQGSTFDARKIDALTDDIAFILQVIEWNNCNCE